MLLLSEIPPRQEHITSLLILELYQLFKDTFILTELFDYTTVIDISLPINTIKLDQSLLDSFS